MAEDCATGGKPGWFRVSRGDGGEITPSIQTIKCRALYVPGFRDARPYHANIFTRCGSVRQRELFDDGSERITESVTFFTDRSRARPILSNGPRTTALKSLGEGTVPAIAVPALCEGTPRVPPQTTGRRPCVPLADVVFKVCFKVFSTVSGRRFMCGSSGRHAKGHVGKCTALQLNFFSPLENEKLLTPDPSLS